MSAVDAQAGSLVRRARAGDQNAMALLREIGLAARKGADRARVAFMAILKYAKQNPAPEASGGLFGFGGEAPAGVPVAPQALLDTRHEHKTFSQASLPPVPRGALDQLFDMEAFPIVVARVCRYRNGLGAAAVVLAAGPRLTQQQVEEMAVSLFGSDDASSAFLYGVKHPSDQDRMEVAEELDANLRRPFAAGQCVGRAVRLQQIRAGAPFSLLSPAIGWEMGE
jgi:hypothetical protein